jgi:hypothetical protein
MRSVDPEKKHQKIAACGSSYRKPGRELIRHMSAAVYTANDHAALSCAQTNSNKNPAPPALVENGRRPAYA